MLTTGMSLEQKIVVTEKVTADNFGSGILPVYATPCMIGLMENTANLCVQPHLDEGCGTVGTSVNIKHVAATPIGMTVTCVAKLVEIDRRRLVFEIKAFDEAGLIGEGIHERFIIDNEKFMAKVNAKKNK